MAFTVKNWEDSPATTTPLSAAALEEMEQRLSSYTDASLAGVNQVAANIRTANYTLALSDAGKAVEMDSTTAKTITIPPNSSVAFPVGTVIEVVRIGTGTVTLAAGSGVTLLSPLGFLNIQDQYGTAGLRKRATNEWIITGSLE